MSDSQQNPKVKEGKKEKKKKIRKEKCDCATASRIRSGYKRGEKMPVKK